MLGSHSKIGLLHHVGGGNMGDNATMDAVIQNIKQRWSNAEIHAFCMNPGDTSERHGIPSHSIRTQTWGFGYTPAGDTATFKKAFKSVAGKWSFLLWLLRGVNALAVRLPRTLFREVQFLAASRRLIKTFDLLVICGGGQLTEWGGPWGFPYTILKWILLAKSVGAECIVLNVGAGPLDHPLSRLFAKRALAAADYVSFRDEQSQALMRKIGFTGKSRVCPDCVYSLNGVPRSLVSSKTDGPSVVGLAPIPFRDPRVHPADKNQAVYEEFIAKSAMLASWLVKHSYSLSLFGTDIGVDPLAIADVQAILEEQSGVVAPQCAGVTSVYELLAAMSRMDYIVTPRFHGVVFAHLLNKPVLAISHHPKVMNFMAELGLSQYCLDIRDLDVSLLIEKFQLLVRNADEVRDCMSRSLEMFRSQLTVQFDELFPYERTRTLPATEPHGLQVRIEMSER